MADFNTDVLFLSPNYSTTRGHQRIAEIIGQLLGSIHDTRSLHWVPFNDIGMADIPSESWFTKYLASLRPRVTLIDFPDYGHTQWLSVLRTLGSTICYLGMRSTLKGRSDFLYDHLFALEPGAEFCSRSVETHIITPITYFCKQDYMRASQGNRHRDTLLIEAGSPDEKRLMRHLVPASICADYSCDMPQPILHHLGQYRHLISALGYSSFWEILGAGCERRTEWFAYDRPLEDAASRLSWLRSAKSSEVEEIRSNIGSCGT